MKRLAIITARGGSKRIPKKNINIKTLLNFSFSYDKLGYVRGVIYADIQFRQ